MSNQARVLVGLALLPALACTSQYSESKMKQENSVTQSSQPSASSQPVQPSTSRPVPGCSATLSLDSQLADGVRMVAVLRNAGPAPLHLLQAVRMPYVLVEGTDQIVLAWSIQPVPENLDLGAIEALDTVEIPAGGEVRRDASLRLPLQVSTHVRGPGRYPGQLLATVKVVAEFGLVSQALDPKARHRQNYTALLADQRTCRTTAVTVTFGKP
jgi:hypothetical protein